MFRPAYHPLKDMPKSVPSVTGMKSKNNFAGMQNLGAELNHVIHTTASSLPVLLC